MKNIEERKADLLMKVREALGNTNRGLSGWLEGIGAVIADDRQLVLELLQPAPTDDEVDEAVNKINDKLKAIKSITDANEKKWYSQKSELQDIVEVSSAIGSTILSVQKRMDIIRRAKQPSCEELTKENTTLKAELAKYDWQPIDTHNGKMFIVVSQGTPDTAEVLKYKGEIPDWVTHWKIL